VAIPNASRIGYCGTIAGTLLPDYQKNPVRF